MAGLPRTRSDETQATQLLEQLIGRNPSPASPSAPKQALALKNKPSEQSLSDDSENSIRPRASQLQFFGLTTTQTQSQTQTQLRPDESYEYSGESQKENTPPNHLEPDIMVNSPPPPTPVSPQDATIGGQGSAAHPTIPGTTSPSRRPERAVTFVSPRASSVSRYTNAPVRSSTHPAPVPSRREPSPESQDSFAQNPLVEDPAQVYLDHHPLFKTTVSQLQGDSDATNSFFTPRIDGSHLAPAPDRSTTERLKMGSQPTEGSGESQEHSSQPHPQVDYDEFYSSSQNAQRVASQQQFTASQLGLNEDTRAMLWNDSQKSQLVATQTQTQEDFSGEDFELPRTQQDVGPGTGISGELTQVADDGVTPEPTQQATQAWDPAPLAPPQAPVAVSETPNTMTTTTTTNTTTRSLARGLNPHRVAKLQAEGLLITPNPPTRDPPQITRADVPPPEPILHPTTVLTNAFGLKRARNEDDDRTTPEPTAGPSNFQALSRSPQRKRTRNSSPDVIPDSEPNGPEDVMATGLTPDQDRLANLPESPLTERNPSPVPAVNESTVDIVPETIDFVASNDPSSDDDVPVSSLFPKRPGPSAPQAEAHVTSSSDGRRTRSTSSSRPTKTRGVKSKTPRGGRGRGRGKTNRTPSTRQQRVQSDDASEVTRRPKSTTPTVRGTPLVDSSSSRGGGTPATEIADDMMNVDELPVVSTDEPKPRTSGKTRGSRRGSGRTNSNPHPVKNIMSMTSTSLSLFGDSTTPARTRKDTALLQDIPAKSRVFAYWKDDQYYYPGTIKLKINDTYQVEFDDEYSAGVPIDKMRRYDLRAGDEVRHLKSVGRVVAMVERNGTTMVSISIKNRGSDEVDEVPMRSIKITRQAIASGWGDRLLTADDVEPLEKEPDDGARSPTLRRSPSKRMTKNNVDPSSLWADTAFVHTGNGKAFTERQRQALRIRIEEADGQVLDDFTNMFTMQGHKHSSGGWNAKREQLQYSAGDRFKRIFLISDEACQKPKYLVALALGIPCVSFQWVVDSLQQQTELDWNQYLLDAGQCDILGGPVSQQVNRFWGNSADDMRLLNFASTIFRGTHILVLDKDCVPSSSHTAAQDIPRIILAMGAKWVEAVGSKGQASMAFTDYDYVVIRKTTHQTDDGAPYVPWSWVKDCLIANRILPVAAFTEVASKAEEEEDDEDGEDDDEDD